VYPALAVLQAIHNQNEGVDENEPVVESLPKTAGKATQTSILWVCSMGGMEVEILKRAGVPFETIPAAGVHGVGMKALPGNLLRLARGYYESKRILRHFRPDVMFYTGGYIAVPMALAGRKIPSLLFLPDIEPGLALKTLARFSDSIAVSVKESRAFFTRHSNLVITGYPTRVDLKKWNIDDARKAFNLEPGLPTLLVFGGSKGARSINRALLTVLPELLSEIQIIHISGQLDWSEIQAAQAGLTKRLIHDPSRVNRYHAFPYLHDEMGAAMSVADLVVSRAGASTLGEYPLFGLPAILVPYPHAWRYQQVNANYLEKQGAAIILADEDLQQKLLPVVHNLIQDEKRREQMRQSMRSLSHPEAAASLAQVLRNLASQTGGRRM
jgi:undecaprenyldiphospho-muramoylpentapeptide beta-N-acetylglucosaminyltransferase